MSTTTEQINNTMLTLAQNVKQLEDENLELKELIDGLLWHTHYKYCAYYNSDNELDKTCPLYRRNNTYRCIELLDKYDFDPNKTDK